MPPTRRSQLGAGERRVMKQSDALVAVVVTALTLAAPVAAHAGGCESDAPIAAALRQKYAEELERVAAEVGARLASLSAAELRQKLDDVEAAVRRAEARADGTHGRGSYRFRLRLERPGP